MRHSFAGLSMFGAREQLPQIIEIRVQSFQGTVNIFASIQEEA